MAFILGAAGRHWRLAWLLGAVLVTGQQGMVSGGGSPEPTDLASLPSAHVTFDAHREQLTIELLPHDVPAADKGMWMWTVPVEQAILPAAGTVFSITTEVVDGAGHVLPRALLHHVNLTDPTRRELFIPTSLHIFAASKETPPVDIPRLVLGVPLERGQRLVVTGMMANASPVTYRSARIRIIIGYRPDSRLFPLWPAYPWVMDVMYPLGKRPGGSKAFDLPPGRTVQGWESSPAVAGYILGVGGHVHDHATAIDFTDVTTGEVLWHGVPQRDSTGRVIWLPVRRFYNWHSLGIHILPAHRYRVAVTYNNPTGHVIADGGMGAVAGLFIPDRDAQWPRVDTTDAIYREDLVNLFTIEPMSDMVGG